MKRVVVTGIGAVTPLGHNTDDLFTNLINGESGIDYITKFDASPLKVKIAGEIKDFIPRTYFHAEK